MKKCIIFCGFFLYFLVFFQSGCDNSDLYDYAKEWSQQVLDLTPGNDGKISVTGRTTNTIDLAWSRAKDETMPQSNLQYYVVYSTGDNINTPADAITNGTQAGGWQTDVNSYSLTTLTPDYTYYITVLVWDGTVTTPQEDAYRKYDTIMVDTRREILYMYAAPAHNGNFYTGAYASIRDELNGYCKNNMPSGHNFTMIYALMTVDATDMLSGIGVPSNNWEVWNTSETIQVAPTWFTIISNLLGSDLNSTLGIGSAFWTGNGTNIGANTCNGWADSTNAELGYIGDGTNTTWSNDNTATCDSTLPVLCVGWY